MKSTNFERAIFLSWYCSIGDCTFCYMSTQKDLIKEPKKAKRSFESIFSEAIITKACGWEVEFLSGGYDSYSFDEIVFITKTISEITGEKQWLNIGVLKKLELEKIKPYIQGFTGAVECVNEQVRKKVCPSKPIEPILKTYKYCEELGIKKGMTQIIGLGETIDDFKYLKKFIEENKIDRITFYALNPQKGTTFTKSPELNYYAEWIRLTRESFPKINIIAGAWHDKTAYFSELLISGADNITKFPAIKMFGSLKAKDMEKEIKDAKREFLGTFTKMPKINWNREVEKLNLDSSLEKRLKKKLDEYIKKMEKNSLDK